MWRLCCCCMVGGYVPRELSYLHTPLGLPSRSPKPTLPDFFDAHRPPQRKQHTAQRLAALSAELRLKASEQEAASASASAPSPTQQPGSETGSSTSDNSGTSPVDGGTPRPEAEV